MKLSPPEWSEALALLDRLLEQPPAQRTEYLDRVDCQQHVKEAVGHLLADRRAIETGGFMHELPRLDPPASRLHEGATLGDYRLLNRIGEGGMGSVWLAERTDELRRRVALKLPHAGFGQEALARRLLRERDILASLEHPHIARLYDVGMGPGDMPFLVLEHVQGLPLLDYCRSAQLGVQARLALFCQVLQAVQYAHAKLVLHRDIKPSNILVDGTGQARLLDFGIAKMLDDAGVGDSQLTSEGGRPFTPDYAAPEQIAGQPLGTACDIYALGVLLFELLTGERPYRLPRGTRGELEEAIVAAQARRPSDVVTQTADAKVPGSTSRQWRKSLRGDLDAIVLTALRKEPGRRYPSADAFAQDIQRHLARLPVHARPERRWYRLQRFVERNALAVSSTAAVVLALVAGTAVARWQADVAQREAAKALAIKNFLVGLFEANSLDQVDAWSKRRQNVEQLLEHSATALRSGLADQAPVKAELQGVVGRLLNDLSLVERAAEVRANRVESLQVAGAPLEVQGEALRDWAESLALQGDSKGARQALERAVSLTGQTGSAKARMQHHAAQAALGKMDLFDAQPHAASQRIEPAARALAQLAPGSRLHADALSALAVLRQAQGRAGDARALLGQSLDIKKSLLGDSPVLLARERYAHATLLRQVVGDFGMAEEELNGAWETMKSAVGPEHLNSAVIEQQLARMLLERGDVVPAQALLAHAGQVFERHAGAVDPARLVESQLYQVEALLANGRLGAAEKAMEAVMQTLGSDGGGNVVYWRFYADMLHADVLVRTGSFAQALETLTRWHERFAREYGTDHASTRDVGLQMVRAHEAAGDLERAASLMDQGLAKQGTGDFGSDHARWRMASLLLERERFSDALPVALAVYRAAHAPSGGTGSAETQGYAAYLLARAQAGLGRHAEARSLFEQSIARFRALGYEHNPLLAQVRAAYASSLIDAGDLALARQQIALASTALRIQDRAGPQFHAGLQRARSKLEKVAESTVRFRVRRGEAHALEPR